jgi:hypothetical protein
MKKLFLGAMALSLLAVSCKKDDTPANVTPTKENLTGSYKLTAMTVQGNNVFDNANDNMNIYESCQRDDIYKLNADMTYQVVDAGTVCNPDGSYDGTDWELLANNQISLDGNTLTITSFDGKTLKVTGSQAGITMNSTYVKQ